MSLFFLLCISCVCGRCLSCIWFVDQIGGVSCWLGMFQLVDTKFIMHLLRHVKQRLRIECPSVAAVLKPVVRGGAIKDVQQIASGVTAEYGNGSQIDAT